MGVCFSSALSARSRSQGSSLRNRMQVSNVAPPHASAEKKPHASISRASGIMSSVRSRVAMSDWWASRSVVSVIRTLLETAAHMGNLRGSGYIISLSKLHRVSIKNSLTEEKRKNKRGRGTGTGRNLGSLRGETRAERPPTTIAPHGKKLGGIIRPPECVADENPACGQDPAESPWLPFLRHRDPYPGKIIGESLCHPHGHLGDHPQFEPHPRSAQPGSCGEEVPGPGIRIHPGTNKEDRGHPGEIRKAVCPGKDHDCRDEYKQKKRRKHRP